ncbi:MAG: 5'-nucleotidase C-terminal domain-containing protein [Bacteroidia bacterium]|nr:5'-nucleotidase C-terminal domain-containing protein [Bacteroidia bacterium]MCZ2277410.1 5'-nucleotidase C-terminal domain-containing protein [Bacteroidia bacterium]
MDYKEIFFNLAVVIHFSRIFFLLASVILTASCSKQSVIVNTTKVQYRPNVHDTIKPDEEIRSFIEPYKQKLDSSMNEIICESETTMQKGQPESLLGNFVSDLCLEYCQKVFPDSIIDFCFFNNGGLRNPIPAGAVTVRNIYELMPFDNELVILVLDGATTLKLINSFAAVGGVPVSGIRFLIDKTTASAIEINGKNFEPNRNYHILTSDYLANGGDKYDFLKSRIGYHQTGILVRNAIVDYCRHQSAAGHKIHSITDNRIRHE